MQNEAQNQSRRNCMRFCKRQDSQIWNLKFLQSFLEKCCRPLFARAMCIRLQVSLRFSRSVFLKLARRLCCQRQFARSPTEKIDWVARADNLGLRILSQSWNSEFDRSQGFRNYLVAFLCFLFGLKKNCDVVRIADHLQSAFLDFSIKLRQHEIG